MDFLLSDAYGDPFEPPPSPPQTYAGNLNQRYKFSSTF